MPDPVTARLGLPLMQPAQAQKHVTLNESLARLDGLVNLVLTSTSTATPPTTVAEGVCYAVPAGAVNAWAGQGGKLAIGSNGGWVFVTPQRGMRAQDLGSGAMLVHDGQGWIEGALTLAPSGAGMSARVAEVEVTLAAATSVTAPMAVPAKAMVIGATARVTQAITGTATGWSLGTAGALDRFGSGMGLAAGSWAHGILGAPMTYENPAPLVLTAQGGAFAGGRVRLALHWWELRLPG